ncbi:MAG: hypothetical protein LBF50_06690 [Azoarcus sp.]|jgi:hypothetical protein|nr:hypothetical protein [Azoarcus sp.]
MNEPRVGYERAYAWRCGKIEFQDARLKLPEGALPIACAPSHTLRAALAICARHVMMVPGVAETEYAGEAAARLSEFAKLVEKIMEDKPWLSRQ